MVLYRASQTPNLLAVSGACGVGSYMLEASVHPTHLYPYPYPYLHCMCRDMRVATSVVDGVQCCLGRMQAVQWCLPSAASPLIGCLALFPSQRSPCLLYLHSLALSVSALFAPWQLSTSATNTLLHYFEMTITIAHCSVPVPKRPSDKAGPSDRCAMPS